MIERGRLRNATYGNSIRIEQLKNLPNALFTTEHNNY